MSVYESYRHAWLKVRVMHALGTSMIIMARKAGALLAIVLATACSGVSGPTTVEPDAATMELRVDGAVALLVDRSGSMAGAGIRVSRGASATLEAVFRDAAGRVVANNSSDFVFDFTPASGAVVRFTRTGTMTGTLDGLTAGITNARATLRHVSLAHDDFPQTIVPVVVQ